MSHEECSKAMVAKSELHLGSPVLFGDDRLVGVVDGLLVSALEALAAFLGLAVAPEAASYAALPDRAAICGNPDLTGFGAVVAIFSNP